VLLIWIRIHTDPPSFWFGRFGSGSRRVKWHTKVKKFKDLFCWMLSFVRWRLLLQLGIPHGFLKISKLPLVSPKNITKIFSYKCFSIFGPQNPVSGPTDTLLCQTALLCQTRARFSL
jgi:hypothetical protein